VPDVQTYALFAGTATLDEIGERGDPENVTVVGGACVV
jgi:hypothetical protein